MSRCPFLSVWSELDGLGGAARLELLAHARDCRSCRERMVASDPASAFAMLALRPVPRAALERVSASVAAAIDSGHAAQLPGARRVVVSTGVAAAVLLAVAVAGMLAGPSHAPRLEDDPAEVAFTASPRGAPRAGVEVLSSPGASRVVDLAVGDTQVVMIFDERLDL